MSTFVLVHGAFHGGWCWHKLVARLEAEGHTVFAPDMPGHGIDQTPIGEVTLESIVAKMTGVIRAAAEPVVLVGHSYGGTIISQTAEAVPDKIRKLVYLTAFIVPSGKASLEIAQSDTENDLAGNVDFAADGKSIKVKDAAIRPAFYAQCPNDDVALARTLLVPEATAGFQTPLLLTPARWGSIPRLYIECLRDRAISLAAQRKMAASAPCDVVSLDTDHSPFFSMPDQLTAILTEL